MSGALTLNVTTVSCCREHSILQRFTHALTEMFGESEKIGEGNDGCAGYKVMLKRKGSMIDDIDVNFWEIDSSNS